MDLPTEPSLNELHVVNLKECEAFVTKDGSIIRELLSHRNSGIRNQSVAEATIGPGCQTEPHFHKVTEEIYYIVAGTAIMLLGNTSRRVSIGDAIAIPPGAVHSINNDGSDEVKLLCCCAPAYEHSDTYIVSN